MFKNTTKSVISKFHSRSGSLYFITHPSAPLAMPLPWLLAHWSNYCDIVRLVEVKLPFDEYMPGPYVCMSVRMYVCLSVYSCRCFSKLKRKWNVESKLRCCPMNTYLGPWLREIEPSQLHTGVTLLIWLQQWSCFRWKWSNHGAIKITTEHNIDVGV